MSFIKSKHSGWTWELKRTPFGGGGGDIVSSVGDAIGGAVSSVGDFVGQAVQDVGTGLASVDKGVGSVPGGWGTVGALATGGALGLGALGGAALDATAVASADSIALSTYGVPAAEAMASYGIPAAELGLPAATTAADLGAIAGTASAEFAGSTAGQEALAMTAQAVAPAAQQSAATLASQLGYSDPIAAIAAGVNPADLGMVQAGSGLGNLVGYAKTGADLIGGLGKVYSGVQAFSGANQMKQIQQQADPFAGYRPQYASQLQNLMNNPQSVTQTPGYQFNLSQGLQGLQAQQAAQGRLVSGGALLQGQQFGQNLAQQTYQQQLQTLASLSGATQSPATGSTAQANLLGGQVGATSAGINALSTGIGQVSNPLATLYSMYNQPSPTPSA
ncbi:hypothetical protein UFOVP146_28 [uncultured Caudovirales phage]|uniref:Uncharacterized protein n=1 Tax=uncultured Caudovirales phage TaxID=2100421 RepID=A0A6J7VKX4_9CAUD|nr:hypothetical protein UFOVP146_28 [uncultured Caudovirales phage]